MSDDCYVPATPGFRLFTYDHYTGQVEYAPIIGWRMVGSVGRPVTPDPTFATVRPYNYTMLYPNDRVMEMCGDETFTYESLDAYCAAVDSAVSMGEEEAYKI